MYSQQSAALGPYLFNSTARYLPRARVPAAHSKDYQTPGPEGSTSCRPSWESPFSIKTVMMYLLTELRLHARERLQPLVVNALAFAGTLPHPGRESRPPVSPPFL